MLRAVGGIADHDDGCVLRERLREAFTLGDRDVADVAEPQVLRTRRRAHVDDQWLLPLLHRGVQGARFEQLARTHGQAGCVPGFGIRGETPGHVVVADAPQAERTFAHFFVVADEHERCIERHDDAGPGVEAPAQRDVDRAFEVALRVGLLVAQIDDPGATLEQGLQRRRRRASRAALRRGRPAAAPCVFRLDVEREVLRRHRLVADHVGDERRLAADLQVRVGPSPADRRRRVRAQVRAAQRTGAVRRQHERCVGQRLQPLHRRERLCGECRRRHVEQVGPADAADEQRVAGERERGVGRGAGTRSRKVIAFGVWPGVAHISSDTLPRVTRSPSRSARCGNPPWRVR
jgi:hypothetical protein